MATYSVYARSAAGQTPAQAEARVVFVREAFAWLALLFAPLVLIYHRLWLVLAAYVAVAILLGITVAIGAVPDASVQVVMTGFNLLLALELPALRGRKLVRRGYHDEGVVIAPRLDLAEQRFFSAWAQRRPAPPAVLPPRPATRAETAGLAAVSSVIAGFPGS